MNEPRLTFPGKDRRWTQWAGRDLGPLPHESALTIIWRFCWRNALHPKDIRYVFGAGVKGFDWNEFGSITGWRCPEVVERRIGSLPARQLFFYDQLRYCPTCLKCGFHSVWHQFRPVVACPMHDVRLLSLCSSCRQPTAHVSEYLSTRAIPFICRSCDGYLAGDGPELDMHLDLRGRSAALRDRLDGYELWITADLLRLISRLMTARDWRPDAQPAFDKLMFRLVDQVDPSPDFAFSDRRPVGIYVWQILPYRSSIMRRSDLYTRRSAVGAYRNAIHKLIRRYIIRRGDGARLQEAGRRIAGRQSLDIGKLGAPLVALALTRHRIEGQLWHVSDCLDARQAVLSFGMPFTDCGTGRYLRIEVQAYVSALFASFLEAASCASDQNRNASTGELLAAGRGVGFVQGYELGWITGMVIFPLTSSVPGSPLRVHRQLPFDPCSAPTDTELMHREFPVPYAWYLGR